MAPEEEREHVDVCEQSRHQNDRNVGRIDQSNRILSTVTTDLTVGKRQFEFRRFCIGHDQEHNNGREQSRNRIDVRQKHRFEPIVRYHLSIRRFTEHVEDHRKRSGWRVLE